MGGSELARQNFEPIFENNIYTLSDSCIISFDRDEQYNLKATISGVINNREEIEPKESGVAGTFVSDENIYAQSDLHNFKFYGIVLGATSLSPLSLDPISSSFTADLITHRIEKSFKLLAEAEIETVNEWYLSAQTYAYFSRSTTRKIDKIFSRSREQIDAEDKNTVRQGSSSSRDHVLCKAKDFSFIVSKVPKTFGPKWSFSLTIEYRKSLGRIPVAEERKAISEIVSFVFGVQLLKIGDSTYDRYENLISQTHESPSGDNVVSKCSGIGTPPIFIGYINDDWNRGGENAECVSSSIYEI